MRAAGRSPEGLGEEDDERDEDGRGMQGVHGRHENDGSHQVCLMAPVH